MILLITGASAGVGCALAAHSLKQGDVVLACARKGFRERTAQNPCHLMGLQKEFPETLFLFEGDVSSESDMQQMAQTISETWGKIDAIAHVAGVKYDLGKTLLECKQETIEKSLAINAMGPILVLQAFLPLLQRGKEKRAMIVLSENVCSPLRKKTFSSSVYKFSKMAEFAALQILQENLKESEIHLFGVHPGKAKTKMSDFAGEISPEESAMHLYRLVSGQICPDCSDGYCNYDGRAMGPLA